MNTIGFFNTAQAWGGGEKWHFEVSRYLHNQGYKVQVIAHTHSVLLKRLQEARVPCRGIVANNLSFLNPLQYRKITAIFKEAKLQTIVMNLSRDVKLAGPCAKKAGVQKIIYRRGSAIPIKNTLLNRYYFKNIITDVLANSQATKRTLLVNNAKLFPEEKIAVIYNGIATEVAQNFPVSKNLQKEHQYKAFTLLTVGRLERQKNHMFLIHLAKVLQDRAIPCKIIIGGSGRLQGELEAMIQKLGVADRVVLAGFVKQPIAFISQADVFVLPSLWEGFGYVLAEAALCEKPIIAFDISSNPEVVVGGKTGYLVPINDIEAFADKVVQLYRYPKLRKTMGEAGAAHVKQHFDQRQQLQKIEKYITT